MPIVTLPGNRKPPPKEKLRLNDMETSVACKLASVYGKYEVQRTGCNSEPYFAVSSLGPCLTPTQQERCMERRRFRSEDLGIFFVPRV